MWTCRKIAEKFLKYLENFWAIPEISGNLSLKGRPPASKVKILIHDYNSCQGWDQEMRYFNSCSCKLALPRFLGQIWSNFGPYCGNNWRSINKAKIARLRKFYALKRGSLKRPEKALLGVAKTSRKNFRALN